MSSVMNTRNNNDMIDHTGTFYAKNDVEISKPIELGADYDN